MVYIIAVLILCTVGGQMRTIRKNISVDATSQANKWLNISHNASQLIRVAIKEMAARASSSWESLIDQNWDPGEIEVMLDQMDGSVGGLSDTALLRPEVFAAVRDLHVFRTALGMSPEDFIKLAIGGFTWTRR
jgi:hypothetical protein